MDPLSHLLAGGAAAYALSGRTLGRRAVAIGAVAALLPDVDFAIRSASDPLLAIEHHRGFTHSLMFMPLGGMVAAVPWLAVRRLRARVGPVLLAAFAGYASHAPLDAATTYGTQLFWPFSSYRVGLDWVSIIDPVVTTVLLVGVLAALVRRSRTGALAALALVVAYIGIGAVQRERAIGAQARIAAERGHQPQRGDAYPTFANQIVWRSLYQAGDSLYLDRIRVPWIGRAAWIPGSAVARLSLSDLPVEIRTDPRTREDFRRFAWFSGGWVARAPADPELIGDARYSLRPDSFEPVWGVRLSPGSPQPTQWVDRSRDRDLRVDELWPTVIGADPRLRPIR
jgi:inner membrane protein